MSESRRAPRYDIKLMVYFPEWEMWGFTSNVSMDGCFIAVNTPVPEGMVTEFWLDIPVVGGVKLRGYVHHRGKADPGIGLQFVQVRFAIEDGSYYGIYTKFVKTLSLLENVKKEYEDSARRRRIIRFQFPSDPTTILNKERG